MKTALFPGSFDPFTRGHADIVTRGLTLFDEIVIAVGHNVEKPGWISCAERVSALRRLYAKEKRVRVEQYTGLTVDFAKEVGATAILRGVRSLKDFELRTRNARGDCELQCYYRRRAGRLSDSFKTGRTYSYELAFTGQIRGQRSSRRYDFCRFFTYRA